MGALSLAGMFLSIVWSAIFALPLMIEGGKFLPPNIWDQLMHGFQYDHSSGVWFFMGVAGFVLCLVLFLSSVRSKRRV